MADNKKKVYASRKWKLTLLIVILAAVGTFIPPILSLILHLEKALVILTGTEFISLISITAGVYIAGNVAQKGVEGRQSFYADNSGVLTLQKKSVLSSGVQEVTIEEGDANKQA